MQEQRAIEGNLGIQLSLQLSCSTRCHRKQLRRLPPCLASPSLIAVLPCGKAEGLRPQRGLPAGHAAAAGGGSQGGGGGRAQAVSRCASGARAGAMQQGRCGLVVCVWQHGGKGVLQARGLVRRDAAAAASQPMPCSSMPAPPRFLHCRSSPPRPARRPAAQHQRQEKGPGAAQPGGGALTHPAAQLHTGRFGGAPPPLLLLPLPPRWCVETCHRTPHRSLGCCEGHAGYGARPGQRAHSLLCSRHQT